MKVTGTVIVEIPRDDLWARLGDRGALAAALPVGGQVTPAGEDRHDVFATAGLAGARATYRGTAELVEVARPDRCRLTVHVTGEPGTVAADVTLEFAATEADPARCTVTYDVDAQLTGRLPALGRQVVEGSVTRVVEQVLLGLGTAPPADADPPAGVSGAEVAEPARPDADADVHAPSAAGPAAPGPERRPSRRGALVASAALGAAAAVVGVLRRRGGGS